MKKKTGSKQPEMSCRSKFWKFTEQMNLKQNKRINKSMEPKNLIFSKQKLRKKTILFCILFRIILLYL